MDETLTKTQVQNLQIASWTLIDKQQLVKLNLGRGENPRCIKINAQRTKEKTKKV